MKLNISFLKIVPLNVISLRMGMIVGVIILVLGFFIFNSNGIKKISPWEKQANELLLDWVGLFLEADRFTEGYRAPISARTFAYISLAAYEVGMPTMKQTHQSLAMQYGLKIPSYPISGDYNLSAALNVTFKSLLDRYFVTAPVFIKNKINQLYENKRHLLSKQFNHELIDKSESFGLEIANMVYNYSASDTIGHMAFLQIYDLNYKIPRGHGKWIPSEEHPLPPLLPYWGKVRPFVIDVSKLHSKPLPEYKYDASSIFYTDALEVMTVSSPLTSENKWIAEFWSDDHQGLTFAPSSRWISITNQIINLEMPETAIVLETYLKVSLALADAGIVCWNSKYIYNLERPENYIKKVLDPDWKPLFPSPNFPAYPSGHSTFGAAAAEVLTQLYGQDYKMKDMSHASRDEFNGKPRSFNSFYEMAFENAFSRIYLGVHFRTDCEEGLVLGFQVGKKISALNLRSKDFSIK
ncbi:MAG: vanadium-dependent haloperoxidase [Saprospiraceae bacterium]|nr:vanadium-dependent haloperoxidase [Saprospiraceae bacterium]